MLLLASVAAPFVVAHYNALAGHLGNNRQPWFLHGLNNLSQERRNQVMSKFYERNEEGTLVNFGWPKYVDGILSQEENFVVEQVDEKFFAWQVRRPRLIQRVRELDADLISLVECDHYEEFWRQEMEELGYGAIYKQRPQSHDGCAIFYRNSVFDLEASQGIELLAGNVMNNGTTSGRPTFGDRVALLALLRHIPTKRRLIFISTHLARNPEDPSKTKDRARQMAQLLYQLTLFASEHDAMDSENDVVVPAMIAGDMNEMNLRHVATIARIKCGLAAEPCHPLVFTSRAPKTPHTSVTGSRRMCIDYLLLQSSHLEVQEVFDVEHINDPIPNERHPSDHLPISFLIAFRDYSRTLRDFAALWAAAVVLSTNNVETDRGVVHQDDSIPSLRSNGPLRPDELRIAFEFFDTNGDGSCNLSDVRTGLAQLHEVKKEQQATILAELKNQIPGLADDDDLAALTLADFTAIYIKSWLRLQVAFLGRVESLQTILDLNLDSLSITEELDNHELLKCVLSSCHDDNSFRNQVRDAFTFFDFDSSGSFDLAEIYKMFSAACPFAVKEDLIRNVFMGMHKNMDERITLGDFADQLVRSQSITDPSLDALKVALSLCAPDDPGTQDRLPRLS